MVEPGFDARSLRISGNTVPRVSIGHFSACNILCSSPFWIPLVTQGLIPSISSRTSSESVRTLLFASDRKFHPTQA